MKSIQAGNLACGVALAFMLAGCDFVRGYAEGHSQQMMVLEQRSPDSPALAIARFVFDDFGSLNTDTLATNALPWKVATTALVTARHNGPARPQDVRDVLTRFGFIYPDAVENWPWAEQPQFARPLGLVAGTIERNFPRVRIDAVNTGCAACHAGVTYTAQGLPTQRAWIGLPNTSLNVDGFVDAVYEALKQASADRERLLDALVQLYPETSQAELQTIRRFMWPRITDRLAELQANGDRALPFRNGGPGVTNGVAALKLRLGVSDPSEADLTYAGTTSIPDLGGRILRTSLLYDGVYAHRQRPRFELRNASSTESPGGMATIVGFFTVPTMGMRPERSLDALPRVAQAMQFVAHYRAPEFPGVIDASLLPKGRSVYEAHCAECHGAYSANNQRPELLVYPNRLVPQQQMRTDATRWQAITPELVAAIDQTAFAKHIDAQNTGGYVAPLLSGLWATAPYLHNGSVPTLWHLMHPQERPQRFQVGGHALDFNAVGIAGKLGEDGAWKYPDDYQPWSTPMLFDATQKGRSNRGHEAEFLALSEAEKSALLEFLKLF